jgi:hypothetical protein
MAKSPEKTFVAALSHWLSYLLSGTGWYILIMAAIASF